MTDNNDDDCDEIDADAKLKFLNECHALPFYRCCRTDTYLDMCDTHCMMLGGHLHIPGYISNLTSVIVMAVISYFLLPVCQVFLKFYCCI